MVRTRRRKKDIGLEYKSFIIRYWLAKVAAGVLVDSMEYKRED
ncbi:TPA: hypothetical protein ACTZ5S_003767 [Bacillus cereus]